MKLTEKDLILENESELMESLSAELDWDVVEKILREKFSIELHDDVAFSGGDMVIHDEELAYKLNFDVRITLSLIFDRTGNFLSASSEKEDDI